MFVGFVWGLVSYCVGVVIWLLWFCRFGGFMLVLVVNLSWAGLRLPRAVVVRELCCYGTMI